MIGGKISGISGMIINWLPDLYNNVDLHPDEPFCNLLVKPLKRKDLLKHLKKNGAFLLREGRRHSIWRLVYEKVPSGERI